MHFRVVTKPGCPYCDQAKALIKMKGHTYEEDRRDTPAGLDAFIREGFRTFPQIFVDEKLIGGFDQLKVYFAALPDDDF